MKQFEKLCTEYRENKRLIEELEAMNDALKGYILIIMGECDTYVEGATKVSYKTVNSSTLDKKALCESYPDIVQAYTIPTQYKRFTVV